MRETLLDVVQPANSQKNYIWITVKVNSALSVSRYRSISFPIEETHAKLFPHSPSTSGHLLVHRDVGEKNPAFTLKKEKYCV